MGIKLGLWIAFGKIAIFTILILLICETGDLSSSWKLLQFFLQTFKVLVIQIFQFFG